ncbi:MAG: endonuclease [Acholeplasmatales bacterium]|jgi:endonuclease I|nr:endonuclease [Acholeplasmatales bacterium]
MKKLITILFFFLLFFLVSCQEKKEATHQVTFLVDQEIYLSLNIKNNRLIGQLKPTDPLKEGFNFSHWEENGYTFSFETRIQRDYNLQAVFMAALDANYYQNINPELVGNGLKAALNNLIKGHKMYSYSTLNAYLTYTDESVTNPGVIYLTYSGPNLENRGWNKEHTWAQSRGEDGSFGTGVGIGTDMHHIRPTLNSLNSERSNYNFDAGGVPTNSYANYGNKVNTSAKTFEPRDEDKGDIARILMYMDVRYEGDDGYDNLTLVENAPTSSPYHGQIGRLSTLMQWNLDDPVSPQERQRNERVFEKQNNRNPFIDHPELANKIWGPTLLEKNNQPKEFKNNFKIIDIYYMDLKRSLYI